jgi:restriction system protein
LSTGRQQAEGEQEEGQKDSTGKSDVGSEIDQVEAEAEDKWKDELLDILLKMSPTAFERLAQRLLRESGFTSVVLTLLADLFG